MKNILWPCRLANLDQYALQRVCQQSYKTQQCKNVGNLVKNTKHSPALHKDINGSTMQPCLAGMLKPQKNKLIPKIVWEIFKGTYIYIYIYAIYMYMYILYIYIYIHTHTHTADASTWNRKPKHVHVYVWLPTWHIRFAMASRTTTGMRVHQSIYFPFSEKLLH